MRPWTRRILELVAQGVTDREAIISGAIAWVPQGYAYRKREQKNASAARQWEARRPEDAGRRETPRRERSAAEVHRIGAREVLSHKLNDLVRQGYLVREGDQYRYPRTGRHAATPTEGDGHGPNPVTPV